MADQRVDVDKAELVVSGRHPSDRLNRARTLVDDHIEAFLPQLDELITEGLVLREPVDIVKYVGRAASNP